MATKEIGVGVIGTGFMGAAHALALHAVGPIFEPRLRPRLEIVADIDRAAADRARERYGFARSTTDWQALVADPAVGLVSVATPNALHKEMALTAIAAGKHVWCEKPMALTATDAREMAEAAEAAGVATLVGYNYLRSPAIRFLEHLIETGDLGELIDLRVSFDEDYMASPDLPHSWRCDRTAAGLGTLGDLGSHAVALARRLAGPIAEVAGSLGTVVAERPAPGGSRRPVENDDLAHALLRFESGLVGSFATSRVAWGRKNGPDLELYGTRAAVRFRQERMNEIQIFRPATRSEDNGFRTVLIGPQHPPYALYTPAPGHSLGFNDLKTAEAAHLLVGIETGAPLRPDFREGASIEAVCHAIARSAAERRWVTVGS